MYILLDLIVFMCNSPDLPEFQSHYTSHFTPFHNTTHNSIPQNPGFPISGLRVWTIKMINTFEVTPLTFTLHTLSLQKKHYPAGPRFSTTPP